MNILPAYSSNISRQILYLGVYWTHTPVISCAMQIDISFHHKNNCTNKHYHKCSLNSCQQNEILLFSNAAKHITDTRKSTSKIIKSISASQQYLSESLFTLFKSLNNGNPHRMTHLYQFKLNSFILPKSEDFLSMKPLVFIKKSDSSVKLRWPRNTGKGSRKSNAYLAAYPRRTKKSRQLAVLCNYHFSTWSPLYQHGLNFTPAWISNYIHYKVWGEITYPGCTIEVVSLKLICEIPQYFSPLRVLIFHRKYKDYVYGRC